MFLKRCHLEYTTLTGPSRAHVVYLIQETRNGELINARGANRMSRITETRVTKYLGPVKNSTVNVCSRVTDDTDDRIDER